MADPTHGYQEFPDPLYNYEKTRRLSCSATGISHPTDPSKNDVMAQMQWWTLSDVKKATKCKIAAACESQGQFISPIDVGSFINIAGWAVDFQRAKAIQDKFGYKLNMPALDTRMQLLYGPTAPNNPRAIENLAQIFAENATSGMIKLLNVEEEVKNVRNLQKSLRS